MDDVVGITFGTFDGVSIISVVVFAEGDVAGVSDCNGVHFSLEPRTAHTEIVVAGDFEGGVRSFTFVATDALSSQVHFVFGNCVLEESCVLSELAGFALGGVDAFTVFVQVEIVAFLTHFAFFGCCGRSFFLGCQTVLVFGLVGCWYTQTLDVGSEFDFAICCVVQENVPSVTFFTSVGQFSSCFTMVNGITGNDDDIFGSYSLCC